MENLNSRTFEEVFNDHLDLSEKGQFEKDMQRNYSPDTIVLMEGKTYHGYKGIRELAIRLEKELPKASYQHKIKQVDKEVALLEWTAKSDENEVNDGVDSYLFRNGKIIAQTIHYTVEKRKFH